ncbi:hypothetical protein LYSHEL_04170 [Lysobacter helvus]|uniref:Transmembrane protein n=1 Tax=Lysobacter helvus TaxID=2675059 RepID=A0ABM7QAR3_9GAMM|nr:MULTISPECIES: hypothetical protein [Lysobacter]BCT94546.1 hypothetical protein LYSHEL_04170 [Lysobacter helvus]
MSKQGGVGALVSGVARAFQWRLLVLWAVGLALPALVVTLPVWQALSSRLDHAINAGDIAQRFDMAQMFEVFKPMFDNQGGDLIAGAGMGSALLALLIAPWLTGMVVASIRAGQTLRFANLLQFGLREYGRMFRMLLWALVPLGIAFAVFAGMGKWADTQAETAILASVGDNAHRLGLIVFGVLFVIAHATVEAGRGMLAAEPARRSVVKAWWRGTKLFFRRPLAVLIVYLGTLLLGEGLALVFGFARTQVGAASVGGFIAGLLLVQLVVMAIAWGRAARLYGMAALASDAQYRESLKPVKQKKVKAVEAATPVADESMESPAVA